MRALELPKRLVVETVARLLSLLRVRLVMIDLDIAHGTCMKVDRYFKLVRFGVLPRRPTIMLGQPGRKVANPVLVDYLRRQLGARIVTPEARLRYGLLFRASKVRPLALPDHYTSTQHQEAMIAVQARWEAEVGGPTLTLDDDHRARGRALLAELGVERDAWFVCLHAREPGWRGEDAASEHRHSNADIRTYLDAVDLIRERGGWVIRMGDRTMRPLPPLERVIDYAHRPGRTDWMDVFLVAECRFFLGSTSGIFGLPFLFGRPVALANVVPTASRPWSSRDLFITKLYRSEREQRLLTFEEGFPAPLRDAVHIEALVDAGISVVDNTPGQIRALALEALERERGTLTYSADDERLQARFSAAASTFLHYGTLSRMGAAFLREHADLLPPESPLAQARLDTRAPPGPG